MLKALFMYNQLSMLKPMYSVRSRFLCCLCFLIFFNYTFSQVSTVRITNARDTIHGFSETQNWILQIQNNQSTVICIPQEKVYNDACSKEFDIGYELLMTDENPAVYADCMMLTHRYLDGTEWIKDSILPHTVRNYSVIIPLCIKPGRNYKVRFVVNLEPLNTGLGKCYSDWYSFFLAAND